MSGIEMMDRLEPRTNDLRKEIRANQEAIESFCWDFQQWLGTGISSRDAFASELLLREALVNAVEHGSKGLADGHVRCEVRGRRGRIFIAVVDQGRGFDWAKVLTFEPKVDACCGRGILIYKNYATRLRFNRAGNAVFIMMKLGRSSENEVKQ
jgi:anti-sigma regulatory factor (Ser/Thr protein kinase)